MRNYSKCKAKLSTRNEYEFLSKLRPASYFTLDTKLTRYSRDLFKSKFTPSEDELSLTVDELEDYYNKVPFLIYFKTFRESFCKNDENLLEPKRLEALNNIFEKVVLSFAAYRPILSDIQREYSLVFQSIINAFNEKVTYIFHHR